jgi:protein phosphatase
LPTEVISSDDCRGLISDDENNQEATGDAFDLLRYIARKRLERGLLTVIDATNVQPESRKDMIQLARDYHVMVYAIIFDLPESICHERNEKRPDRHFGKPVVRNHLAALRRGVYGMSKEGIREKFFLRTPNDVEEASIERTKLWQDKRDEHGPFDIIGDVHGCYDELTELLAKLGYEVESYVATHKDGRKLIFLGDLVDRGPKTPEVLKLAMASVRAGTAICVPGNHDDKLQKKLHGRDVKLAHGLAESMNQLKKEEPEFVQDAAKFLDGLISHYVMDDGKLVVAHAGMKENMQGRTSGVVRSFAMFGETTGEIDEFGLPVRYNWASEYRGRAKVVYGHTPIPYAEWLNGTINIDTGCVFGGKLSALRYPEMELVSVPAHQVYAESARPIDFEAAGLSSQHQIDDVLDLEDVFGKRLVTTALGGNITIREENSSAALEAMSRFASNPKWLIYLPPTMSPSETSYLEGYLEHPSQAFEYFSSVGVPQVICEEKHMGSRAVVVLCRDLDVAKIRFGLESGEQGAVYTRTGRRFFDDAALEAAFLARIVSSMDRAETWETLSTNWVILDCELMPWSAKAQELLKKQYAPLGAAAGKSLTQEKELLTKAAQLNDSPEFKALLERTEERQELAQRYVESYLRYCWSVHSMEDLRLAPFHILASEGAVHSDKDHLWHMQTISAFAKEDSLLFQTPYLVVDTGDEARVGQGIAWWEELTGKGGEGMVIKPLTFIAQGPKGLVQPALKCRGREYLRIIYGPEYTLPQHLDRLRKRGLSRKRSLAAREFALGMEGLQRFVQREPLRRVHECVFAVLALESEPVDPRL